MPRSITNHSFSQAPSVKPPRSTFQRDHGHKTTLEDAGVLYPIYVDEALPGDTFALQMFGYTRMSVPLFPVMDNMFLDTQFFSIPVRLIHNNFKKMMGEQDNPTDSIDFQTPIMTSPASVGYPVGSLSDYMGIPTDIPDLEHCSYWHRAYNLTWNTWYRDQNLQDSVVVDKDDGPDDPADYTLLKRGKRHDYFTSCLPWPVKGGVAVDLPLGTQAPVKHDATGSGSYLKVRDLNDNLERLGVTGSLVTTTNDTGAGFQMYADLSAATAATISELRQAFQLQRLLERDARGGTRYPEVILSHFGVTSPDARQQRPEYLGGGTSPININPVYNTAALGPVLGKAGAYATNAINGHGFVKSFTEHCIIIGLASIRADLTYQQGLPRMFSRRTRYDFYWPSLAHLSEQPVLNKEIYAQGSLAATDDNVFGYQEPYAEYRYKPSQITGQFRSTYSAPLDSWHLSQEFTSLPGLNSAFIEENPPMDRIVATPSEPKFISDFLFKIRATRCMPLYGVPGLIDHF